MTTRILSARRKAEAHHAEIVRRHWQGATVRSLGADYGVSSGYVGQVIATFRHRFGLDRLLPVYTLTPCAKCFALVAAKLAHPPVLCADCTSELLPPAEPGESGNP